MKPKNNKKGEELRSMDDYELDFSQIFEKAQTDKVAKVKYYTEIEEIKALFKGNGKFEEIQFVEDKKESK